MLKRFFIKNYKSNDYYLKKKAEYTLNYNLIMIFAIVVIIATEIVLHGNILSSLTKGGIAIGLTLLSLFIVFVGRYELGINMMILLGLIRIMMVSFYTTPFQFYAMSVVLLIAISLVHNKKYQFFMTAIAIFLLQISQTIRLRQLVEQGVLERRSFIEAFMTLYLFIAIIILLKNIIEIVDNEIEEREQLIRYAELDPLTSIYNRRKITKIFDNFVAESSTVKVILFDIDDFKKVNDIYGHDVGDEILLEVSKLVKNEFQQVELGRWGGEEFLALTRSCIGCGEAIREAVMNHKFTKNINITVSVGVTEVKTDDTIGTATKRADEAMYQSKQSGKNMTTTIKE